MERSLAVSMGPRAGVAVLLLAALLLLGLGPLAAEAQRARAGWTVGSSYANVRLDPLDPSFVGYLKWNGGGQISWTREGPTDDPGGGRDSDAADGAVRAVDTSLRDYVEPGLVPFPAADEFMSSPLPRTLYLNESRLIAVDLILTFPASTYWSACQEHHRPIDVELYADGKRIGGAVHGQSAYLLDSPPREDLGYGRCPFRFPSEVAVLPEGTVLKLRVVNAAHNAPFQYGLAGTHASSIRFPLYAPDDLAFRQLGVLKVRETPGRSSVTSGEEGSSAALALAAAVSLAPAARGRSRTSVLVLLLAGGLAGCLDSGPAPGPAEGTGSTSTHSIEEGTGLGEGLGSLLGQVHDDYYAPMEGVHIALAGTNNFTFTDGRGRFQLRNVPADVYTLRVDLEHYQSLESEVRILAGKLTTVDVTLVPHVQRTGDARIHRHDYWGGLESRLLMDDYDLGHECAGTGGSNCFVKADFTIPPDASKINTILPGTRQIDVVLDWDPEALGVPRLGLMFHNPSDNNAFTNYSVLYPRGPREPYHIVTNWEMNDRGHQLFSDWHFQVFTANQDAPQSTLAYYRGSVPLEIPSIRVSLSIHKGIMPLEPAHRNLWDGQNAIKVVRDQTGSLGAVLVPSTPAAPASFSNPFVPTRPIPPETLWLDIYLNVSSPSTPHYDFDLYYKPGRIGGTPSCQPSCERDPLLTKAGVVPIVGTTGHFRMPVAEGDADGVYAAASNWHFAIDPSDKNAHFVNSWRTYGELEYQTDIKFNVIAHRDPMP